MPAWDDYTWANFPDAKLVPITQEDLPERDSPPA